MLCAYARARSSCSRMILPTAAAATLFLFWGDAVLYHRPHVSARVPSDDEED